MTHNYSHHCQFYHQYYYTYYLSRVSNYHNGGLCIFISRIKSSKVLDLKNSHNAARVSTLDSHRQSASDVEITLTVVHGSHHIISSYSVDLSDEIPSMVTPDSGRLNEHCHEVDAGNDVRVFSESFILLSLL